MASNARIAEIKGLTGIRMKMNHNNRRYSQGFWTLSSIDIFDIIVGVISLGDSFYSLSIRQGFEVVRCEQKKVLPLMEHLSHTALIIDTEDYYSFVLLSISGSGL